MKEWVRGGGMREEMGNEKRKRRSEVKRREWGLKGGEKDGEVRR